MHDLNKLWLPAFLLFSVGAWQADYAMIFPLKARIAGLAGITICLTGFIIRYNQLNNKGGGESGLWNTGTRLVFTGISFYTLHPVAITLTILLLFIIRTREIPEYASQQPVKYESSPWLIAATLLFIMDIIHEYTTWKKLIFPVTDVVIYLAIVLVIVIILLKNNKINKVSR